MQEAITRTDIYIFIALGASLLFSGGCLAAVAYLFGQVAQLQQTLDRQRHTHPTFAAFETIMFKAGKALYALEDRNALSAVLDIVINALIGIADVAKAAITGPTAYREDADQKS